MHNFIDLIEKKITEMHDKLKSQNTFINEVSTSIEKLVSDKQVTSGNINFLNGVIHAYSDVANGLKSLVGSVAEAVVEDVKKELE